MDTCFFRCACHFRYAAARSIRLDNAADFRHICTCNQCCPGFLHLQMQYLPGIIVLAVGVLAGIIFMVKLIRAGLCRFRSQMIYLILGLMLGSLYAIVMGPTTLDVPKSPVSVDTFHIAAFFIGITVLGGLELVKWYMKRQATIQK